MEKGPLNEAFDSIISREPLTVNNGDDSSREDAILREKGKNYVFLKLLLILWEVFMIFLWLS